MIKRIIQAWVVIVLGCVGSLMFLEWSHGAFVRHTRSAPPIFAMVGALAVVIIITWALRLIQGSGPLNGFSRQTTKPKDEVTKNVAAPKS